ncbi:unnamed protein product [Mytilus edulis]|uniref:Uncharacterized protein n=1 Tax=Mytilus edulis TaxID=6550 RepID=A0A8S3VG19_MYTED|nr:unnamed protein product [Mytilus edulis]
MDGYLLYTFILIKYISQIHGNVCISWSLYKDQLRIVCKTDDLHLPIVFFNPSGESVAYCSAPNTTTQCHASLHTNNITQDIISGETVYVVNRALNNLPLNDTWGCYHGFKLDKVSVEVTVPESIGLKVQLKVTVSGPKYVQTQQKILLFCTSNTDSKDSSAYFHINNQFRTKIYKNASGCFSSIDSSMCQSGVCQCLSDGRSFILQYDAEIARGVLQFKCSMDFKIFGTISDCLFVTVVDISGPFITSNKDFPLHAGSVAEWTCKAISRDHIIELYMNCLETFVQTDRSNNNTYVAKLSKRVKSSDNGTLCTCKLSSVITSVTSIKLHIISPPVLVDKSVTMGTTVTLSVKFLSMQKPNKPKWYHKNRLLPNSTQFYQTTSKDIIVIRMYGEIVHYTGYIASLTVVEKDTKRFKFLLLLRNDYGTAETTFELNNRDNGSNVFNIRLFSLVLLAVFLFLISVILSTVLVYRQRRDSKRKSESRAIYFAAAGQINNVNIYDVTTSPYEEINDGDLVPEHSNDLINPSAMNNTDNYEEEGVRQYLELE